uniref:Uncharacterized protein n=1 Tax=Noctiluca scintillans TaxID=2966 RepID=A0A7S1AT53_NOCSC|mmetsp:Transcript_58666/g.156185  ORF Transcript_58666/g.156185 Transcript_58666/m.156185 type:complete len:207 (+) Transcript_58666:79-699(+)
MPSRLAWCLACYCVFRGHAARISSDLDDDANEDVDAHGEDREGVFSSVAELDTGALGAIEDAAELGNSGAELDIKSDERRSRVIGGGGQHSSTRRRKWGYLEHVAEGYAYNRGRSHGHSWSGSRGRGHHYDRSHSHGGGHYHGGYHSHSGKGKGSHRGHHWLEVKAEEEPRIKSEAVMETSTTVGTGAFTELARGGEDSVKAIVEG